MAALAMLRERRLAWMAPVPGTPSPHPALDRVLAVAQVAAAVVVGVTALVLVAVSR